MKKDFKNRIYSFQILILLCLMHYSTATFSQLQNDIRIKGIPQNLYWHNKPIAYNITDNTLIIEAGEKTDLFRDPNATYNTNSAPQLLFTPHEDFVLTCAIEHNFENKWDAGALVLVSDSIRWIKYCFEKDYTGAKRVVSVVTKGFSDDSNGVEISGNKVYYKMAKANNVITLYYSTNSKNWFLVRHFQFETDKNFKVGFLAQSPVGKKCIVKFSDILYEAKRIKDPYAGE